MLDGLDAIDWGALRDAYGEAAGIPGMIRGLTSADRATREQSLEDLEDQVCHQGSFAEASPHVVPFLIELLGEPKVGGKGGILDLLTGLARARSYQEGLLGERGPVAESLRADPDFEERLRQERGWMEATRRAVEAGLPLYLSLLGDDREGLRYPAANLLGALGAARAPVAEGLRGAFAREARDGVRCGLLLLLGEVGGMDDVPFLKEVLARASGPAVVLPGRPAGANPPLRWGAAVALVRILRDQAPPEAVRVVTEAARGQSPLGADWDGLPEGERASVRGAVLTLALLGPDAGVGPIGRALDRVDPEDLWDVLDVLLGLAFPVGDEPTGPRRLETLTAPQTAALAALADSDAVWGLPRVTASALEWLGLPTSRHELRTFLAG